MSLNRGAIDRQIQSYKPVTGIEISGGERGSVHSVKTRCKTAFQVQRVCGVLLCVRVLLFLLLAVNGVETNRGPGPGATEKVEAPLHRVVDAVVGIPAKATSDYLEVILRALKV